MITKSSVSTRYSSNVSPTQKKTTNRPLFQNQHKSADIDIVFENIKYSVKTVDNNSRTPNFNKKTQKEKQILKGVSGIFKSGKVTGIMGASGAGKTTLLNILACRIKPNKGGKLFANSLEYNHQKFGSFANYVMQNDILMQTLTVRQTLQFAAKLKHNLTQIQIKLKVKQIASQMKLEKCLDSFVGGVTLKGISGGEKKRTSIAFELMSDPRVILLDEPTSGLDSLTSYIIVSRLKKLAHHHNKTVIMTIHQPNYEIFELMDDLLILMQGKIIYQSQTSQVTPYFQKHFNLICPQQMNPSDFFMSKIHHQNQNNVERFSEYQSAYQTYQKQRIQQKIENKSSSHVTFRSVNVGFANAMKALVLRNVLNTFRNPMFMKAKFLQAIFIALYLGGLVFNLGLTDYTIVKNWHSIAGIMFFMTLSGMVLALSPIALAFPLQKLVLFKQQDSKMYTISQYFLAKNLFEIPETIIISILFVSIYYFMVDLSNSPGQFFLHVFIFILMGFNGSSLGLLLGSVILDQKSASIIVPAFVFPFMLISGFFKNRIQLPDWAGWFQYLSPFKYGFIAFIENEVTNKESLIDTLNLDLTKWQAIGLLFCLGLFYRVLSLFFLWVLQKKSQ